MKRLVGCNYCGFRYVEGDFVHVCQVRKDKVLKKAIKVINSCVSERQVFQASRYAKLACNMFPDLYDPLRTALTRVEVNFSRVGRGEMPFPLFVPEGC